MCTDQAAFTSKTVQDSIKQVDFDVRGQQEKYFFTGGSIMDSVLVRIECLKLKCLNDGLYKLFLKNIFSLHKILIDGQVACVLLVMFLSAV